MPGVLMKMMRIGKAGRKGMGWSKQNPRWTQRPAFFSLHHPGVGRMCSQLSSVQAHVRYPKNIHSRAELEKWDWAKEWTHGSLLRTTPGVSFSLFICLFLAVPHVTCGILAPQLGIEPAPLHWSAVITTGPPGKSLVVSWWKKSKTKQKNPLIAGSLCWAFQTISPKWLTNVEVTKK